MSHSIEIIGLGAGDLEQLPLGIYRKLVSHNGSIHVRTVDHPVITALNDEGCTFISYDDTYEKYDRFESVYEDIVRQLIVAAKQSPVVYAVPGHPMLAEKTVQLLLEQQEVDINILGGQSYLDDLFTTLQIDPIEGFQFIDATAFKRNQLDYRSHLIFCQVYDEFVASEVKLSLLEDLSPEHVVTVVDAVGSKNERVTKIPLVELDQSVQLSNFTSIYVPPVTEDSLNHQFHRLREIISELRGPNGCPWDKKQTHKSLRKYLIEETYEFIEAVNKQDDDGMIEEIGDVLLQVMLHSQIGEDEGYFTIDDIIQTLTEKMIRRHPHVFGDRTADTADEVVANWEEIKQTEKSERLTSLLDDIPAELPQLLIAEELQKKAAKVGFDWDDVKPIWQKVAEEVNEVKEAIKSGDKEDMESEFGDLLFVIVNLARYYKVNPDLAIHRTNTTFKRRFMCIEKKLADKQLSFTDVTLQDLDKFWNQAKLEEKI